MRAEGKKKLIHSIGFQGNSINGSRFSSINPQWKYVPSLSGTISRNSTTQICASFFKVHVFSNCTCSCVDIRNHHYEFHSQAIKPKARINWHMTPSSAEAVFLPQLTRDFSNFPPPPSLPTSFPQHYISEWLCFRERGRMMQRELLWFWMDGALPQVVAFVPARMIDRRSGRNCGIKKYNMKTIINLIVYSHFPTHPEMDWRPRCDARLWRSQLCG